MRLYPAGGACSAARRSARIGLRGRRSRGNRVTFARTSCTDTAGYGATRTASIPAASSATIAKRSTARPIFPWRGSGVCIGMAFALQEALIVLAHLLQRYRFDLIAGHVVPRNNAYASAPLWDANDR